MSYIIAPKLEKLVEQQLCDDLKVYGIMSNQYKFDWSDSCIEGYDAVYLDGELENYSGINVFNEKDEHIVEGGMEFIYELEYPFFLYIGNTCIFMN